MKQASAEEVSEYSKTIGIGFLEGCGIGVPLSLGLRYYLDKKTGFRNAGVFPRTLAFIAPVVFCGITMLEQHSRHFEQSEREAHMHIHGKEPTDTTASSLGWLHPASVGKLLSENKYKVIVAGWAAVLGGTFWAINRDPYQTRAQKIVQARVYAQGATVLMLIGTVLLGARSASKVDANTERAKARQADRDSWKRDLAYIREEK